jgi:hypothetical protein
MLLQKMKSVIHHHVSVCARDAERINRHSVKPGLGLRLRESCSRESEMPVVGDFVVPVLEPDIRRNYTSFKS